MSDDLVNKMEQQGFANPELQKALEKEDFTDSGNCAVLMRQTAGNLRYVYELDLWIYWDGHRWLRDDSGEHLDACCINVALHWRQKATEHLAAAEKAHEDSVRKEYQQLAKKFMAHEARTRHKGGIAAIKSMAQVRKGFPISAAKLDTHRHLLGVANGVVDLRTGTLKPDARDDYVTLRSPVRYVPSAACPRFEQFVMEISATPHADDPKTFVPRADLIEYHQTRAGYMLSGEVREQVLFNDTGAGSNGKNVLLDTLSAILGPLAYEMPRGALEMSRYGADAERASPAIRGLLHKRMARASEWPPDRKADEVTIKKLTGDAEITARDLHSKQVTFALTAKIVIPSNVPIPLENADAAIRGRFHVVPFDVRWNRPGETERDPALPDGDPVLSSTLRSEYEGILAWAVRGAVRYYAAGLPRPEPVQAKTGAYLRSQDGLRSWLDACERTLNVTADNPSIAEALESYASWCREQGVRQKVVAANTLSLELKKYNVLVDRAGSGDGRVTRAALILPEDGIFA